MSFYLSILLVSCIWVLCRGHLHPLTLECQLSCPEGACCETALGNISCCGFRNGVCCPGGQGCCPQESVCLPFGICKSNFGFSSALSLSPRTQKAGEQIQAIRTRPVICPDRTSTCAQNSTCCKVTSGSWGCCPMPNAVCCSDQKHCCPNGNTCDLAKGTCLPHKTPESGSSVSTISKLETSAGKHMCPDGRHACRNEETCCSGRNGTWSCCPSANSVCCADGEHCCPSGFHCDVAGKRCMKGTAPPAKGSCPEGFRCPNNSTCCSSSDGWACCPFPNAVCCSDLIHCCPEHTKCDDSKKACVPLDTPGTVLSMLNHRISPVVSDLCPSGLVSCPNGTCCKNQFGWDACCPHPQAVCCSDGFCCPSGMRCNDRERTCIPDPSFPQQIGVIDPMMKATHRTEVGDDNLCPDNHSVCPKGQTCCLLIDRSFGCCPLANGTCCADRHHCCPSGTSCTTDGSCVRTHGESGRRIINAEVMVPNIKTTLRRGPHLTKTTVGDVVHATFCGSCEYDWLCCPDAEGSPNRMCCPEPGSICCPDGKHCCPRQSVCLSDGRCASYAHQEELSYSVPLSRSKNSIHYWRPLPKPTKEWPAAVPKRARVNVLYLVDAYYVAHSEQHIVCPDRERYCDFGEKCVASNKHGYVCIPVGATSCHPDADTWCPPGTTCYQGFTCRSQY